MKGAFLILTLILVNGLCAAELPVSLVGSGPELKYLKTERGDQVCDFSHAGFGGGGVGHIDQSTDGTFNGGAGGSGIVVIRYPSYLVPAASTTGSPEMYVAGAWRVYKFVASGTITF
jgi:hypothetical protein